MSLFPASPTNGQIIIVNGIAYTYDSAQTAWVRTSIPGNTVVYGENTYTATAGQTVYSANYTAPYVNVFSNGSKLSPSQYTATNGTSITLLTSSNAGDIVDIIAYTASNILTAPNFSGTATFADSGTWSNGGINSSIIGGTTPAAGHFTTMSLTTALSPSYGGKPSNRYTNFGTITGILLATTTLVSGGLGSAWKLTPTTTGRVRFLLTGSGYSGNGTAALAVPYYGTGTAPTAGAAIPGGAVQGTSAQTQFGPGPPEIPATFYFEATGLTLNTAYWFDLMISAPGGAGIRFDPTSIMIEEF